MEQTAVYYGRRVQEGVHARAQAEAEDGRHRNLPTGRPWEPIDGSDALGHVGAVVPRRFRACASPPKLMDLNFPAFIALCFLAFIRFWRSGDFVAQISIIISCICGSAEKQGFRSLQQSTTLITPCIYYCAVVECGSREPSLGSFQRIN